MAKEDKTVMSAAMAEKFPWTTEGLAEELGMSVNTFRVWKNKMEKFKKLAKPAIPSMYCMKDPDSGLRLRYSDAYLDKLREARTDNKKRAKRDTSSAAHHAILKLNVLVFDQVVADYLLRKFKNSSGIEEHIKDYIKDLVSPTINKIAEIKRRHEEELRNAMA